MKQVSFIAGICLIVLIVIAGILIFDINRPVPPSYASIASFEECVAGGYPILESYPPQCTTPDGRVFIQSDLATSTFEDFNQGTSSPSQGIASSTSKTPLPNQATTNNHL